jgi:hypothetical protein
MDIEGFNDPHAGELFHFVVTGGTRPTHIEVYIDRAQVLSKDCADPPCHEMIAIPVGAKGSEVLVIARDALGNVEQHRFEVETLTPAQVE